MEINQHFIDVELSRQKLMKDCNITKEQTKDIKSLATAYANQQYNSREFIRISEKLNNPKDKPFFKFGKTWVNSGTVIFLKSESEICNKYDPTLKKLINTGHRFVIGINFNQKSKANGIAVHLLSTSDKCNIQYKNGIKLFGDYSKYSNGKDVFMDMNTIWVIKKNCIKSIEYTFEDEDRYLLLHTVGDANFKTAEYKLGIIDSNVILQDFEDFKFSQTIEYSPKKQDYEDDLAVRSFIWKQCNYLSIKKCITKYNNGLKVISEDSYKLLEGLIKSVDAEKDLTIADKDQLIINHLYTCIKQLPKDEYIKLVRDLKRGYKLDE